MRHLKLKKLPMPGVRRLTMAVWGEPMDPSTSGSLTLRVDKVLSYLRRFEAHTGRHATVTHLLTQACARAQARYPELNTVRRFNSVYAQERTGVTLCVLYKNAAGDAGVNLVKVRDAEKKTLVELVDDMNDLIERARSAEPVPSIFDYIPTFAMRPFIRLTNFLMYDLNVRLPFLPEDPAPHFEITNVGTLGAESATVPLTPYIRNTIEIAMGAIHEAPVVENGKVVVGKVMQITGSFDHRMMEGLQMSLLNDVVKQMFENPEESFDSLPQPQSIGRSGR